MITKEALDKAFSLLDEASILSKSERQTALATPGNDPIIKGEDMDWDKDDMKKALEQATFLQKGGLDKEVGCGVMSKGGFTLEVAQASWDKALSIANAVGNAGAITEQNMPLVKAEEITELIKGEISKTVDPLSSNIENLNDAIQKGFQGMKTIVQSLQEANDILIKSNTELSGRLEAVEKMPAAPRKSAPNEGYFERFNKGQDSNILGENCYDVTSKEDRDRLTDKLFEENKRVFQKSEQNDPFLEGVINTIEVTNTVPVYAYKKLAAMGIRLQMPSGSTK